MIARRAIDAWNEGGIDAFMVLLHPEVEWTPDPDWPEAETCWGREEVRGFLVAFFDAWADVGIELDELAPSGEVVVVRFRWLLRGKSSGVEQELPVSGVLAARDGLILSARFFLDHGAALHAAGLKPDA